MVFSSAQYAHHSDRQVTALDKASADRSWRVNNCTLIPFHSSFLLGIILMEDGTCTDDILFSVDCHGCHDIDDGIVIARMCGAGSYRECYLVVFMDCICDFQSMEKSNVWSLWSTCGS